MERGVKILDKVSKEDLEKGQAYFAYETRWLKPDSQLLLIEDITIEVEEIEEQVA